MYTVLLIDDEKNITDSLMSTIPWINLGVENVIAYNDSLQAFARIEQGGIDLIISDIQMPQLNGLSLLEAARKSFPEIHCILLTAYDEFHYALQALRLGVDNYLMKPLLTQELIETIESTFDNIYANRRNQEQIFQENLLRRWVYNKISPAELGEKSVYAGINIYHAEYCIIGFQSRKNVSLSALLHKSIQLISCFADCWQLRDNPERIFLIIGDRKIDKFKIWHILSEAAEEIGLTDSADIAIGRIVHNFTNVPTGFQSTCDLLKEASGHSQGTLLCFSEAAQHAPESLAAINFDSLSPIVSSALEYITEHFSEGITLKEFAYLRKSNAAYLGYLFKSETGFFFNDYLTDYRLEKAKELLSTTNIKVNAIAKNVGYTNPSYFTATFRRKTNLSPQRYRELYGENNE